MRFLLTAFLFNIYLFCFAQNDSINKNRIITFSADSFQEQKINGGDPPNPLTFFQPAHSFNKKRAIGIISSETVLASSSLITLWQVWYAQYPHARFHFFNDNGEWLQMDKCGHVTTCYTIGLYGIRMLQWSGVERKKAIWLGGLTGLSYQFMLEMFDGFSSGWGFSMGDMTANSIGYGILVSQELLWNEQRITPKFSFHQSNFPQYNSSLLGKTYEEQLLKDYNAQTYWLSFNVASFLRNENKFPRWLNVAFGYGANGMTGGRTNPVMMNSAGNIISFERYRQYYLSMDIDLTKIPTHSAFLKTVFETFGFLKIPAPGIEFSQGKIYGHWLSY